MTNSRNAAEHAGGLFERGLVCHCGPYRRLARTHPCSHGRADHQNGPPPPGRDARRRAPTLICFLALVLYTGLAYALEGPPQPLLSGTGARGHAPHSVPPGHVAPESDRLRSLDPDARTTGSLWHHRSTKTLLGDVLSKGSARICDHELAGLLGSVASRGRSRQMFGVDPGAGGGGQTELQMIDHRFRVAGLGAAELRAVFARL